MDAEEKKEEEEGIGVKEKRSNERRGEGMREEEKE